MRRLMPLWGAGRPLAPLSKTVNKLKSKTSIFALDLLLWCRRDNKPGPLLLRLRLRLRLLLLLPLLLWFLWLRLLLLTLPRRCGPRRHNPHAVTVTATNSERYNFVKLLLYPIAKQTALGLVCPE
jgi:hypothetical protein